MMKTKKKHEKEIKEIQKKIRRKTKEKTNSKIVLGRSKGKSHITREDKYKEEHNKIDISKLDKIISIDIKEKTIIVEPRVTMEKIVRFTKYYNLIPKVIPEFKGITVGGAIQGSGIESSSFKYGLFDRSVIEMECVLGNGDCVNASPYINSDLFYSISGSHGSFAILTLVKLELVDYYPYVKIRYSKFDTIDHGISALKKVCNDSSVDYVDAIVFGELTCSTKYFWNKWFFQHIIQKTTQKWSNYHYKNNNIFFNDIYSDIMRTEDYLFRYDRCAFWAGIIVNWNSFLFRFLFGWFHSSTNLFRMRKIWKIEDMEKKGICQDYLIPISNSKIFIEKVIQKVYIFPIWICPTKAIKYKDIDNKMIPYSTFTLTEPNYLMKENPKQEFNSNSNSNSNSDF
ncbi:24-dehydrocholesterol reductase [Anaeramoeba ignava]|uniref:Delta(24)-sterol reductase n=1 Tax=Anaeramoeba ignava TaxID=1746090 RepID=A0A9Q0RCI5_ANAIG|nr:24-dehydrocholesterol reductase [Anaeramoeba ignava]